MHTFVCMRQTHSCNWGATRKAFERYQEAMTILESRGAAEPDRADYQRDLSVSYDRLGDLLRALGQGEAARQYYPQALEIRQRLVAAEPRRLPARLSVSYNGWVTARALPREGRASTTHRPWRSRLPDRADYQRDLSVSYDKLGDLLQALGQGEAARQYYQQALEIRQRLAVAEPDRADYQRDLSVLRRWATCSRPGPRRRGAPVLPTGSLEIAQRLAVAEPDRADYQRDLSISYEQLGDLLRALGQGSGAPVLPTGPGDSPAAGRGRTRPRRLPMGPGCFSSPDGSRRTRQQHRASYPGVGNSP